jgi:uncharacterized protein
MTDAVPAQTVRSIRFDPAAPVAADQPNTTHEWYADPTGRFSSGFWSSEPGRWPVSYEEDELCVLVAGTVRLTDAAGQDAVYRAGETFLIPAGFTGFWESVEPVRKFYAIHMAPKNTDAR